MNRKLLRFFIFLLIIVTITYCDKDPFYEDDTNYTNTYNCPSPDNSYGNTHYWYNIPIYQMSLPTGSVLQDRYPYDYSHIDYANYLIPYNVYQEANYIQVRVHNYSGNPNTSSLQHLKSKISIRRDTLIGSFSDFTITGDGEYYQIHPTTPLEYDVKYYIIFEAGAFDNSFLRGFAITWRQPY